MDKLFSFKTSLLPNEKDINRKTAKDVFGIVIPVKGECDFSLEIAKMTGYNDCFYFSKNFKKNLGICPKKYRQRNNDFFTDIVLKK